MKIDKATWNNLLQLAEDKDVYLEGNILKVIDADGDEKHVAYLKHAITQDKDARKRRLEVTKQVQSQNIELKETQKRLQDALASAEGAKKSVEHDLDALRKRTQYHMIRQVVKVALLMIVGTGVLTTTLYFTALLSDKNTEVLGNAWSSILGIILTNSFSIIGTILGIKYANEEKIKD